MIQQCGRKGQVVLTVPSNDIYRSRNCANKLFSQLGHGVLVNGGSKLDFLSELRHLEEHCLGFTGNRIVEEGYGFNGVVNISFELFSRVKLCVISHRDGIVARGIRRNIKSGFWVWNQRFQDRGSDIQGRRAFIWSCPVYGR